MLLCTIVLRAQNDDLIPKTKKEIEREKKTDLKERKRITSSGIYSVSEVAYGYKFGKTEKTGVKESEIKYDRNGRKIEETTYNPSDGSVQAQTRYQYDSRGNLIEETVIRNDNIQKTSHRYNSENLKEETVVYNVDGSVAKKISYVYDSNGLLLEVVGYYSDGRVYMRDSYYYDLGGRLMELKNSQNKFEYQYDDHGNVSSIGKYALYYKMSDSSLYVLTDYYRLDHDADDNLTGMAHFTADSTMKSRLQYILDDKGQLVREKEFNSENKAVFQRTLVRDGSGNITDEIGNDHGRKFRNEYKHDSRGNTTESISYDQINEPVQDVRYVYVKYGKPKEEPESVRQNSSLEMKGLFPDEFYQLLGSRVIAPDGVYLGKIVADTVDPQSIVNVFGQYGSENSESSIFNRSTSYGGEKGIFSPFNDMSPSPPALYKDGKFINYFTTNDNYRPRTSPDSLIQFLIKLSKPSQH